MISTQTLKDLEGKLSGALHYSDTMRKLYATDASIYRQLPLAVAYPVDKEDIKLLIHFARENKTSLIPRTAGTSLAGQCVGDGIVVDVSKHFTKIIEFNKDESWVMVEPGVVRDELNAFLAKEGFFFGPNTSTANRCMIGGMVGNNSSGTTSIKYGVTRDHVLELETILSDGSEAIFSKRHSSDSLSGLEKEIYNQVEKLLNEEGAKEEIFGNFPKETIHRRNTGYAIDLLAGQSDYRDFTKLLAGSEGTLAFTTAIKIHVDPLPPKNVALVCGHFSSIHESMQAVLIAMQSEPYACELMDKIILDCTKENIEQIENRFFVEGDPAAVLVTELRSDDEKDLQSQIELLIARYKESGLGYAFPVVSGNDIEKVWALRAAGLGLLSNIPGDAKPIACIEDTAVDVNDLPNYIDEFEKMMADFNQQAVYYAHAGAGELHLRPILNLKDKKGREQFRQICESSARLVKKYNGSLSGEHGDGRVRAEFIPLMIGENNYKRLQRIKSIWDPYNIFNPGKIVYALPIDEYLRYEEGQEDVEVDTVFDFSESDGILKAAEKCNGSADCRKISGLMCPSYQASKDEKTTTRARANILREIITENEGKKDVLANDQLIEVLDLCLSCKGCKRECPSNVDMAMMKAEVLHQYQKRNGVKFKTRAFAEIHKINSLASLFPNLSNWFLSGKYTSKWLKGFLGVSQERSLPLIGEESPQRWFLKNYNNLRPKKPIGELYLFLDEFSRFNEVELVIKAVELLSKLGYEVHLSKNEASGRAYISKGLLDQAKKCALKNVSFYTDLISEEKPLVGIEPSAILTFRDEYPKLLRGEIQKEAKQLSTNVLTFEEFIHREWKAGRIKEESFGTEQKDVLVHVHCHQKAISKPGITKEILSIPKNNTVEVINSGCCGMAGSFGYEKEHYELSIKVGETRLFPAVRNANTETMVVAAGTSCRHQIKDGTQRNSVHPIEVLSLALKED